MKKLLVSRKILSNGLDAIIIKNGYIPSVSINLTYKVGSQDEIIGSRGFAHLFEHLMFEGTKNLPKGEFDKLCSLAGGNNNAYTTYDWTSYIMTLPATQIELGIWLEAERMKNFLINEESLKNQQSVVTEEIKQVVENQPYGRWRDLLAKNAFSPNSSYSWEVHGKVEDIQNANMQTVQDFHERFYVSNNANLVIVGDVEIEKAYELIEKHFDLNNSNEQIKRNKFLDEYKIGAKSDSYIDNVPDVGLFIAFHTPGLKQKDHLIGDVLANVLGHGKSSLLNNNLVYSEQIAAFAGAFSDTREHTSLFTLFAIASSTEITANHLFDSINKQISKIKNGEIDPQIAQKTSNQLKTNLAHQLMQSAGLADNVGKMAMLFDDPEKVFTLSDKYDEITHNDVVDFANKYLNEENMIRIEVLPQ